MIVPGWTVEIVSSEKNWTKYKISAQQKYLRFQEVIELWQTSPDFIHFFNELLSASLYEAYFWEVSPICLDTCEKEFEFVLIDSPALVNVRADKTAFAKYFNHPAYATSFLNLSGDSTLIVPVEISAAKNYSHLATFVRNAPEAQISAFWNLVGAEVSKAVGQQPKWLSTSGLGVYWVHVRIDPKPKYFHYEAYKQRKE